MRHRSAVVIGLAGALIGLGAVIGLGESGSVDLVVRDPNDAVLVRATVGAGNPVVLRYRNSLYGSLAEERFVLRDGALHLVELAADERAVLAEYYAVEAPVERATIGDRAWRAPPREPVVLTELAIAATDLGERTLLIPGRPALELWRHAADDRPTVRLTLEPSR